MEELQQSTLIETEIMRANLVARLENLDKELALHRTKGKLPVGVIHEMLLVHRTLIEVLGVRKPVVEKVEHKHKLPMFETVIAAPRNAPRGHNYVWSEEDHGWVVKQQQTIDATFSEPARLTEGSDE